MWKLSRKPFACISGKLTKQSSSGLFDLLDERPLTKAELRLFCTLLFGTGVEQIPDPVSEWNAFTKYVERSLEHESLQWNPLKKKKKPWVSVKKLNRIYNQTGLFTRKYG
jgi:hypothetical protein